MQANGEALKNMENTLEELRVFSGYYRKILNRDIEPNKDIEMHLQYIRILDVDVCHPFLLGVCHDYAIGKIGADIFIKVLELIQSYVWRRTVVGLLTAGMNKTYQYF